MDLAGRDLVIDLGEKLLLAETAHAAVDRLRPRQQLTDFEINMTRS